MAGLRLFKVVALRAHNTTKGRAKASDRVIYVLGNNVIQVKDAVEGHGAGGKAGRVPGIKVVVEVSCVGIRDLGRMERLGRMETGR